MFASFTRTRKAGRLLSAFLFAGLIAACDPAAVGPSATFDTSRPVPVALLIPRGSEETSDTLLADSLENAARLAMADLTGVNIDLRVYSTAGDAEIAGTQAAQAINDGAKIIIGPLYAEAANAAGLAAAPAGVNVLTFSNNPTIAGGNVFVMGSTFQNTANRLVRFAKQRGKDDIVIVHAQDVAGQVGRTAIQDAIITNNATLAGVVDYPLSQQGVVDAVPLIKSAVEDGTATSIFMTSSTAAGLPLLAQLLPEAGVRSDTTQFIGLTRWDIPVQTLAMPGVQGGWFALPDPNRTAAFRAKYEAAYGAPPHPIAGLGFDGIAAIGALAAKGRGNPLSTAALTQEAGFQGASGIFRFRRDGTNERGLAIATIRDGRVELIDQAPRSFGRAGF